MMMMMMMMMMVEMMIVENMSIDFETISRTKRKWDIFSQNVIEQLWQNGPNLGGGFQKKDTPAKFNMEPGNDGFQ